MTSYHEYEGKLLTLRQISAATGLPYSTLWGRARNGQPLTEKPYNHGVADANRRRTKHGATVDARQGKSDRLYSVWCVMKDRCSNPNNVAYHRYGGRGIKVCDEWVNDFAAFRAAVGTCPAKGMTLDRIDNDEDYAPGNMRWATRKEQANNRYTNVRITYNGMTKTLAEWAEHFGWAYSVLGNRWKNGEREIARLMRPPFSRAENY